MKKIFLQFLLIQILFIFVLNDDQIFLKIEKSKAHTDQTNKLTPLVVSASSEDKSDKIRGIYLICVVDTSGSMSNTIHLVKSSLKYVVESMKEEDYFSLIRFGSNAYKESSLSSMTEQNKASVLKKIDGLKANGGTNINAGLLEALKEIKTIKNSEDEKIVSIILLSDGWDQTKNTVANFKRTLETDYKDITTFTLHTFGYGESHDADLMYQLSLVKDGGYFFIRHLVKVYDSFLEIYGSLSSVYKLNVELIIQSNFTINKVFGQEDMYKASLTQKTPYTFKVKLIHFVYGKTYSFVTLVDIPDNTEIGVEVLKATILPFNKVASYYWDSENTNPAYEEYIRGITCNYFTNAYNSFNSQGIEKGKSILKTGYDWIKINYSGKRLSNDNIKSWGDEFQEAIEDFNNFKSYGKPNFLSKLRELKTLKLGSNYNDENSYQRKIIDDSYNINTKDYSLIIITQNKKISSSNKNYHYFYLKDGAGEINGLHFSEEHSSLVIYSSGNSEIEIKPKNNLEYYYKLETIQVQRLQTKIDINRGGQFIFEKDFPFDFYTRIDGQRDITFNIQILDLAFKHNEEEAETEINHLFVIKAYILNEQQINNIKDSSLISGKEFIGYYDKAFRVGKLVIKKEEIYKQLSSNYNNYIYVVVSKASDNGIEYQKVKGKFSFVSMNYIFSVLPESYYVFSNLFPDQNTPHLYTIKMEPKLNKLLRIEFASGSELDCKILKYKINSSTSDEFYQESEDLKPKITRKVYMGKTYIDIKQSDNEESKFEKVIVSIFSTNGENIAGKDETKNSYTLRYSTYSDYGIYDFNDLSDTEGMVQVKRNEIDERNITINFSGLKYKKIDELDYIPENARFSLKVFSIIKRKQKIYETISLFQNNEPDLFFEKNVNDANGYFNFQVDTKKNYFLTLFSVSSETYEILSYKNQKIYPIQKDVIIDDNNSFQYELEEETKKNIQISDNITSQYLEIKIADFKEGEYGTLYASLDDTVYKSVQPSNNMIIITKEKCQGKNISLEVKLKDGKKTEYFLSIRLVNKIEIDPGENFFFEMLEEYNGKLEITLNNANENKNKINIFASSSTGNFTIKNLGNNFGKSEMFGSQSINIIQDSPTLLEISAKTGEFISLFTHIVKNPKKRQLSNYEINLYGYLDSVDSIDCIYFDDKISELEKFQIRILGEKEISIKYNHDTNFEYTKTGIMYVKEFSKTKLEKICLKSKNELETSFFGMQIVDISQQNISTVILQPTIFGAFYNDKLSKNEIRYYRQGLFDPIQKDDLRYLYNVRQISGEIKVYISTCNNFPFCKYKKEDLESNKNIKSLYNLNEYFIYSKKAKDFTKYDPEKIPVYIVECLSDSCEYIFILNKNTDILDLTQLKKYSSKVYKNNIDKFSVTPSNKNIKMISISLYTHSGEVMLNTNDHCEDIKHTVFGNMEKLEIPDTCNIGHSFEIYVQANLDSVYSIEYNEKEDIKYSNIKSNIIHIENINKEKLIEFTPVKNKYFIKFIPINCEISIKYGNNNLVPSQYNIYYYNSENETERYYNFTISTESEDCMIYTYLEELTEDFYGILSDQVPYYVSLNKNNKNYKLIYPLPNEKYNPMYKINLFEEIPIKINQRVEEEKDKEINAVFTKDIKPDVNIFNNCSQNEICYLILEINYEKELEYPIILEIIPKSSNNIPGVLIDNIIKQDFTTVEGKGQRYISKILKNEEGDIYFNTKYFSGELSGKIIKIDKKSWKNRYELPEKNEYLKYDNLKQKISFTKKETYNCDIGCYLLVEVHNLDVFKEDDDYKNLNMDYSIFLKKSNNLVQLRLNEIIIGTLEKTINENYIEYYSIQVPYSTNKLFIDYSSENTNVIINSGKKKPTKDQSEHSFESNGKSQIYVIEMDNLRDKKFIIGIYTNKLNNGYSQYSFRVRAENKLIKNYIYSDMNTENICEKKGNNDPCYFLIPIINKQEKANLLLYGISTSTSDDLIISYKKINIHKNIKDGEYIDDGIYTKTSNNEFIKNMLLIHNSELKMEEDENILIKIDSPTKGLITLLHTFKTNLKESLLNPKNKMLYSLNKEDQLHLNIPNGAKSLIHINAINGKAKGGYENDEDSVQEMSGKYSSMYLQGVENNDNKKIIIKTDSENDFYFYTYMKIGSIKRNINDIGIGSAKLRTGEGFPIEFYSKITENNDYTVNFNIDNIKEMEDKNTGISMFNMKGYIVSEEIIEQLKSDDTMVYSGTPLIGKYETGFGVAKLILSKKDIEKYYVKNKNNYLYLKIEDSYSNPAILNDISGVITILQNNNLDYVTPDNIYINGNLEPGQSSANKYKISKKNSNDKKIRIEFSSSSPNIKYKIYYQQTQAKLLQSTEVDYKVNENLGKQNIDVNLNNNFDSFIFEVYGDGGVNDKNKLSYTLRYRTDEGKKVFKNYSIKGEIEIIKTEKNNEIRNVTLTIPSIQDSDTLVQATYYLKTYAYSEKDFLLNNTISLIDGIKTYKEYEFKINQPTISKAIELPNDNNDYYAVVTAITPDKELLSYKAIIIKNNESKIKIWLIILIIVGSLIVIISLILIIRYILRKRQNVVENDNEIIPLTEQNNFEDK